MTQIQVVFYSMYGHVYEMAKEVANGVSEVAGTHVDLYQVQELIPDDRLEASGAKAAREGFAHLPVIKPDDLASADAVIFGTPTRFGNMCAQMRNFLDQTSQLWMQGGLVGKVGSVFTSTATQHGGAGDHDHQLPYHSFAPWDDRGRSSLYRAATYGDWRGQRRHTVRGIHHSQSGRIQMAFRQ